ncbi:response regulator [Aggregicoccus sp. 17bor-14]|uniref:response regulator n=1 Tax=Myxococcaceae TaxID=31 RepID=UPI00129C5D11|nr:MULTISPECIES: response regulator [Myxococcaceae]MBF5044344.1 response regulator [Simulacricoccus sp. 17bor-14]MRI90091.1 response regulator [Aggregicoccus sp. 17bor-14]
MTSPKKILLVDDSPTVLAMERMVLGRAGYALVSATNGQEALALARTERPDLVLMDVIMPQMNGFEACAALRASADTAALPVILVTTRSEPEHVEAGYEAGCNDYVTKPFNPAELLAKVAGLLGEGA